jgi:hypothetical protein
VAADELRMPTHCPSSVGFSSVAIVGWLGDGKGKATVLKARSVLSTTQTTLVLG